MVTTEVELPPATHVGRVALVVNDLDAMIQFYEEVVGLTTMTRDADAATLGAGSDELLVLDADTEASARGRDKAGLFHTAFRVPTRAALGDALARAQSRGRLSGASDHLVSEALYLGDPEDNGVEIYCDRPRAEWPMTDDDRVEMDTLPLDLDALRAAGSRADTAPDGTDLGHVHLEITNLDDAREFYVDTLGLGVRQAWGDSALFVAAGDYHHHVGLNTWKGRAEPASGRGLDYFELVVPDDEALDAVRSRLQDAELGVQQAEDGFALTDPDDIGVRVRR